MWIAGPFSMITFNQAVINMRHNLKFVLQTPPFYGHVLLLLQLSVYGALAWGPDELYITRHAAVKRRCGCGGLQRALIVKLFLWAVRSVRSSTRRCWRMCRPTRPATWKRWNPFSNSHRRRKGRGSASWSRSSSPSTGTSMSPTMRGEQRSACVPICDIRWLIIVIIICSAWKRFTMSSTKPWCPSTSKMIWNGGRTTTAPACPPTGPRLRCVKNTFPAQKRCNPETANNATLRL